MTESMIEEVIEANIKHNLTERGYVLRKVVYDKRSETIFIKIDGWFKLEDVMYIYIHNKYPQLKLSTLSIWECFWLRIRTKILEAILTYVNKIREYLRNKR